MTVKTYQKRKKKAQNRTWGRNCTLPNEKLQWLVLILVGLEQSLGLSPFGWAGCKPHLEISRISKKCFKRVSAEQNKSIKLGQIPLDEIFQTCWQRLCSLGPDVMKLWSETLIPGGMTDSYFVLLSFCYTKSTAVRCVRRRENVWKHPCPFASCLFTREEEQERKEKREK